MENVLQSELERVSNLPGVSSRGINKGRRVKRPATKDCTDGDDLSDSMTPEHQRFKSDNDDNFDLELMMLQDTQSTSSPTDSLTADRAPSRLSASGTTETVLTSPYEHVEIKNEPVDEDSPIEIPIHDDDSPVQIDNRKGQREIPDRPSCSGTSAAAFNNHSSDDASRLRAELAAAQKSNLSLREELNTRDFHIAQLAEDFFRLQEQFKQLSRRFQCALTDVKPHQSDTEDYNGGDS